MRNPSSIGIPVVNAAEVTPGIAVKRSRISFCIRMTRSGSATCAGGIDTRTSCRRSGLANPGSTFSRAWKLRSMSPEPTKITKANATWITTSAFCESRRSRLWLPPRPPPRRTVASRDPAYLTTGITPKSNPDSAETTSANESTTGSIEISASRGRLVGPSAMRT